MPQGSKASYTPKQRRQAHHIEASVKRKGGSSKKAERIGWATVNKQDGGSKGHGSSRRKASSRPSRKSSKKSTRRSR